MSDTVSKVIAELSKNTLSNYAVKATAARAASKNQLDKKKKSSELAHQGKRPTSVPGKKGVTIDKSIQYDKTIRRSQKTLAKRDAGLQRAGERLLKKEEVEELMSKGFTVEEIEAIERHLFEEEVVAEDAEYHKKMAAQHKEKMLDAKEEDHRDGMTSHRMAHDAHMAAAKEYDKAPDSHTATKAKIAGQKAMDHTKKANSMFEEVEEEK